MNIHLKFYRILTVTWCMCKYNVVSSAFLYRNFLFFTTTTKIYCSLDGLLIATHLFESDVFKTHLWTKRDIPLPQL